DGRIWLPPQSRGRGRRRAPLRGAPCRSVSTRARAGCCEAAPGASARARACACRPRVSRRGPERGRDSRGATPLRHCACPYPPARGALPGAARESRTPEGRKLRRPLLAVALGLAILGGVAAALVLTPGSNKAAAIVVPPNSAAMIDENGKTIESYVGVGRRPTAVAVGAGGVWVANSESGTVSRLDPATGKFVDTIGVGADLNDVAVGLGSVWVADGNDG